jgi:hypothetical protein
MKAKNKHKSHFSFRTNEEEFEVIRKLKEEYGINLSGAFKMFLRKYLKVLEDNDKNIQI